MKIAILPGDGIGPEIVGQAQRVLDVLRDEGLPLDDRSARRWAAPATTRRAIRCRDATLALAQASDAMLLGAVGGPQYDTLPRELRPEQGLLRIRKALSLFANLRPALLYPELAAASSLKPEVVAGLDILIVRELTGDIYFGQPRGRRAQRARATTKASTRCTTACRRSSASRASGFEAARKRGKRLCSVDKANVLDTSILWRETVTRARRGVSGRRAVAHVRRQRGDAARAQPEAVRRDRHRQHVRRHPLRRGVDARRARSACCRRRRSTRNRRACTSRSTARRPTSRARTRRIRWRRSCRSR